MAIILFCSLYFKGVGKRNAIKKQNLTGRAKSTKCLIQHYALMKGSRFHRTWVKQVDRGVKGELRRRKDPEIKGGLLKSRSGGGAD